MIFLPFKPKNQGQKHYILWYEFLLINIFCGFLGFRFLILFLPESTEGVLKHFLTTGIGEIRIFSRDEKKQDDMSTAA